LVGDVQVGAAVAAFGVRLGVVMVLRSLEFEGQKSPDNFGSATLSVAW
jgi:hypothetical protein